MITCILVSHNKPFFVKQAIQSIIDQSFKTWQTIIIDSGILLNDGFFSFITDHRFEIYPSNETDYIRKNKAMAPWCFNECARRNLIKNDLLIYLCDDDILYNNAFAVFCEYNKDIMYASQDIVIFDKESFIVGERRALEIKGKYGGRLDCVVDYGQMCHRSKLLGQVWWPEEKGTETHADGVFMERLGQISPFYPIDIKIGQNRRTPLSTYAPYI